MNGNFLRWVGGVVAGLVLLAVSGGILFDREMATQIAEHSAAIKSIQSQIDAYRADQRAVGSYNRVDAERELHYRDVAIERLERRLDALENGNRRGPQ